MLQLIVTLVCIECGKTFKKTYQRKPKIPRSTCSNSCLQKIWRRKNPIKSRAVTRRWRDNHPEYLAPAAKKIYQRRKEILKARTKERKKRNPQQHYASVILNYSLLLGTIKKPKRCQRCKKIKRLDGHHHKGYMQPLDVLWLCRRCHCIVDGRRKHPLLH